MMKFSNIKKSPWTTVIGALIMLASIVSVFVPNLEIDWSSASIGIMLGGSLLFIEDPKSGSKAAVIIFLMSGICLQSCVTYERCQDKFGQSTDTLMVKETVEVVIHDTIVKASDTVGTIIKFREQGKIITDTVVVENPATGMALKYWRDEAGRLRAQCESKQDTLIITNTVTKEIEVPCPPVTQFEPPTEAKWFHKWWFWLCFGFVLCLLIGVVFRMILKAIFK